MIFLNIIQGKMKKLEILIVEDEPKLARTLSEFLSFENYAVNTESTAMSALQFFQANKQQIDLILLDLMLPDMTGFHVLREIRKVSEVPVIILSALSALEDQMNGFEKGADDFITKPFSLELLKLHMEAVLKRAGKYKRSLVCGDIEVILSEQKVYLKGKMLDTTKKEYDLMLYFMEHPGIVLTRNMILDAVWDYDYAGDVRTVDTLVKQLRKKLGDVANYIKTIYGAGYIFGEGQYEEK